MNCSTCGKELLGEGQPCSECSVPSSPPLDEEAAGNDDVVSEGFGARFVRATMIWKGNLGELILLTLIFLFVVWIPLLNIGFLSGYIRALVRVARGRHVRLGLIFKTWDCFGSLFVYLTLVGLALILLAKVRYVGPAIGSLLCIVMAPALYAIVDGGMTFREALAWNLSVIVRDFIPWFLAILVGLVLSMSGMVIVVAGVVVTFSWGYLLVILQYEASRLKLEDEAT